MKPPLYQGILTRYFVVWCLGVFVVNLGWEVTSAEPAIKAPSRSMIQAEESVQQRIRLSGAEVAVAFRPLDGRQELLFQPDLIFHAASTMKIPVMIKKCWRPLQATVQDRPGPVVPWRCPEDN